MYDSSDPRSINYVRKYNKEKFNYKYIISFIIILLIINLVNWFFIKNKLILILVNIIYILVWLKNIIIFLIKIYQRIAPISIRNKCRFEPSCSNYMMQVLTKYGLIKGLYKGFKRLKKCNITGGGFDYP